MDRTIIDNINVKIKPHQHLFHLGDFGNYNRIKDIKCMVTLILGNYEIKDMLADHNNDFEQFKKYLLDLGFASIKESGYDININYNKVHLCHEPLKCDLEKFNLYGHVHGLCKVKKHGFDVGVDSHNFLPVDEEAVAFYKNAIELYYDGNIFCD
jgi:calcineurin-like phosphoesterase family protein